MASQVPPKRAAAFNLGLTLYLNTGAAVTNPGTITAKISKDFGDYADVGTVSEEDSTYGQIKLALSAAEMTADVISLYVVDNTSGCVPWTATIYTAANTLDERAAMLGVVASGTAQSATATTIVLAAASSFANDELNGAVVVITGGTGIGQSRVITDYTGASDEAVVDTWATTPSGTITYVILAAPPASASALPGVNMTQIAGAAVSTTTAQLGVNVVQISGDETAANNLELACDGTGYNLGAGSVVAASVTGAVGSVAGNVVGSVASVAAGGIVAATLAAGSIALKKNNALAKFPFVMRDSTNHAPAAGLTVTATRSIDGAAFAGGTLSAVTEVASGVYTVDFGAGDLNGATIVLRCTAAASDTTFISIVTNP